MRVPYIRLAALFGLLLVSGCGDSMTLPEAGEASANLTTVVAPEEEHQAPTCCDPIIVIVKGPECDPYLSLTWCEESGDDCMSSTGEFQTTFGCVPPGGGGGSPPSCPAWDTNYPTCSSGPPPPGDGICTADEYGTLCEGGNRPECERRLDAPTVCVTRPPNTTEWAALGETVDRMTENTDYCRGTKALAREMYAAGREGGRIVLWDGRNYVPGTNQQRMVWGRNDSDWRGRIIEMDSYLAFAVPSLLAHEALHAYLNSINWPGTREEQEAWVSARESECAG
jgi:hypothetical protein